MVDNRREKRAAKRIQSALQIPYVMALRLLRENKIIVEDKIITDTRTGTRYYD